MFLLGKEFLLRTDHAALRNLLRRDLPPTTRVERWILRLSEYTFRIEYKRGQDNVIADVLSRLPFAGAELNETTSSALQTSNEINANLDGKHSAHSQVETAKVDLINLNLDPFSSQSESESSDSDSGSDADSTADSDLEGDAFDNDNNRTETCTVLETSTPFVDLPISREGLSAKDFTIPDS